MTPTDAIKLISKTVNQKDENGVYPVLYDWLTGDRLERLGIYADGRYEVGYKVGREQRPEDRPIAYIRCPGDLEAESVPDNVKEFLNETLVKKEEGYYNPPTNEIFTTGECIRLYCQKGVVEWALIDLHIRLSEAYIRMQKKKRKKQTILEKAKKIIKEVVNKKDKNGAYEVLYNYLIAGSQNWLGIYAKGKKYRNNHYKVGEDVGREYNPQERPIAYIRCSDCGITGKTCPLDLLSYLEHLMIKEENGYYVKGTGEILTFQEGIYRFCQKGQTKHLLLMLEKDLLESFVEIHMVNKKEKK